MPMNLNITASSRFGEISREIRASLSEGVTLAAERLMTHAVDRSPWDQGTLAASAAVSTPLSSQGGDAEADVTFDTPYAARLHEHPEYNFSTDANPNAQGKYLEGAALDNKDELAEIVAKRVSRG